MRFLKGGVERESSDWLHKFANQEHVHLWGWQFSDMEHEYNTLEYAEESYESLDYAIDYA